MMESTKQARVFNVEKGNGMSILTKQFQDALSKIEPGEDADHAADAHAEVREVLHDDADLMEWGLHSVLIGSYRREVSIRRVKDVDVLCELPNLPDDHDPQDLLEKFVGLLAVEYGDRVTKNDRSVKVDFPDFDMHVDVVPARCADDDWEIPDRDGGWEKTHPVKFSELSTARNQAHNEKYVPVVKLLRQTRRALRSDAKPGGFFVEVAAYQAFEGIPDGDSDQSPRSTAEYYTVALEAMAPILRDHADDVARLMNPAIPDQELHIRATQQELDAIADEWGQAAVDAREALKSTNDQDAAQTFKRLLGQNSDGDDVFEVPVAVSAGHRSLPSGESPTFG
ncbi:SMODS domain-containing nucleotidyltransferase [Arthrobacter sp. TMN-49]